MRRLRFMAWPAVPLALYIAYAAVGLPHIRWSFTWVDEGQGHDPLADRFFLSCTFWGPFGRFTFDHPADGKCAWVIFRKAPSSTQG